MANSPDDLKPSDADEALTDQDFAADVSGALGSDSTGPGTQRAVRATDTSWTRREIDFCGPRRNLRTFAVALSAKCRTSGDLPISS